MLFIAGVISTLLFYPTPNAKAASQTITHYTYSGHGTDWQKYLQTMAKRFKETTGITVTIVQSNNNTEYVPKLTAMIAGGAAPDVTDINPVNAGQLLRQEIFADLSPFIAEAQTPINSMPVAVIQGLKTAGGATWMLPVSVYPTVTMFNSDLFKQVGLIAPSQLKAGWNWDTMLESARRLTLDKNGDGKPERYGVSRLEWRWDAQVHQAGGQLYDRSILPRQSNFDSPEVLAGIKFVYNMLAVEKVATLSGTTYNIWSGNCGFTLAYGPLAIPTYLMHAPFAWDVSEDPVGPVNRASRLHPDGFQLVNSSKQKAVAWKWINFLVSSPQNQLEMSQITGRMPTSREAMLEYPTVFSGLPKNWLAFVNQAFDPAAYTPYVFSNAQVEVLVNNTLDKVWKGQMLPEVALQQLDAKVTPLLQGK
jgi:multiple sugar transport system substrate-binding protein